MKQLEKELGVSRCQKGGNNGVPLNPRPKELRPKPSRGNKEMTKVGLPETTQESIIHVDATPDDDYPLRILRAYRENCNCKFVSEPPNALTDMMNEHCDKRAAVLDKAIAALEADKS